MTARVQTSQGIVQGTEEGGVQVFRGIPFARPPVGPLRFRPPEPPERWSGVRDATRSGPGSYQANRPLAPILGIIVPEQSEDCLSLNVWTPGAGGGARPVLVWIHGGAWVIGSGSEPAYDGAALARRGDVVVVTVNYRLGVFGFLRGRELSGGALDTTGNEAMLDLVAALEWVRDEIAAFGGDAANVTIMGESAGAVNVACLLTMPRARWLFHKAVMESGSLNLTRTPEAAGDVFRRVLDELGVAPEQAAKLIDAPAEELLGAQNRATQKSALVTFGPVADGAIIPRRPYDAITAGAAAGIPVLAGTNLEEMNLYRFLDPSIDTLDEEGLVMRATALFPGSGPDGVPHGRRAVDVYRSAREARGDDVTPATVWLAMSTDHIFRAGTTTLLERQAAHMPQTYAYLFTWQATAPDKPRGAVHALELPFVFGTLDVSEIGRMAGRTPAAYALSERMQDAWLAFARSGSPRTESLPAWEPYAPPRRATMLLGELCEQVDAPRETERAFWAPFIA